MEQTESQSRFFPDLIPVGNQLVATQHIVLISFPPGEPIEIQLSNGRAVHSLDEHETIWLRRLFLGEAPPASEPTVAPAAQIMKDIE